MYIINMLHRLMAVQSYLSVLVELQPAKHAHSAQSTYLYRGEQGILDDVLRQNFFSAAKVAR